MSSGLLTESVLPLAYMYVCPHAPTVVHLVLVMLLIPHAILLLTSLM